MSTISDSHNIVTPSDRPNPGSGVERVRARITNSSEVQVEAGGEGVALRPGADRVERGVVAPEANPVEHHLGVGIEVPVEARSDARRLVALARGDGRVRQVDMVVA